METVTITLTRAEALELAYCVHGIYNRLSADLRREAVGDGGLEAYDAMAAKVVEALSK